MLVNDIVSKVERRISDGNYDSKINDNGTHTHTHKSINTQKVTAVRIEMK